MRRSRLAAPAVRAVVGALLVVGVSGCVQVAGEGVGPQKDAPAGGGKPAGGGGGGAVPSGAPAVAGGGEIGHGERGTVRDKAGREMPARGGRPDRKSIEPSRRPSSAGPSRSAPAPRPEPEPDEERSAPSGSPSASVSAPQPEPSGSPPVPTPSPAAS